jgi:hypothetical protein
VEAFQTVCVNICKVNIIFCLHFVGSVIFFLIIRWTKDAYNLCSKYSPHHHVDVLGDTQTNVKVSRHIMTFNCIKFHTHVFKAMRSKGESILLIISTSLLVISILRKVPWRWKIRTKFFLQSLKGRDHLEDLDIERIMLKFILVNRVWGCVLDSSG